MSIAEIAKLKRVSERLVKEDLLFGGSVEGQKKDEENKPSEDESDKSKIKKDVNETFSESIEETANRRRKIVGLLQAGISEEEIYEEYNGIPKEVISKDIRYIRRNRITNSRQVYAAKPETRQNEKQKAKIIRPSRKSSKRAYRGKRVKRTKEIDARIIETYFDSTLTTKDIARKLGISQGTLHLYTKQLQKEGKLPAGRRPYPVISRRKARAKSIENQTNSKALTQKELALKTKAKIKELLKKGQTRAVLNTFSKILEDPKLPEEKRNVVEGIISIINQLSGGEKKLMGKEVKTPHRMEQEDEQK